MITTAQALDLLSVGLIDNDGYFASPYDGTKLVPVSENMTLVERHGQVLDFDSLESAVSYLIEDIVTSIELF